MRELCHTDASITAAPHHIYMQALKRVCWLQFRLQTGHLVLYHRVNEISRY